MKNKIFGIILAIMLSLPTAVWAVDDVAVNEDVQPSLEEVAEPSTLDEETDAEEVQTPVMPVAPYKQPISKKKIIKKFLMAMGGVVVSSLLLYGGLTAYNRVRTGFAKPIKTPEGETPLQTPDDLEGAVKTFLEKTKWG